MTQLKIIPLGGMGRVTQNMFLYEYEDEILVVDCGIGFPDTYMPGVDILIPDISYLLSKIGQGKRLVGMVLSHGHDDHIAATAYLLSALPDCPIYASRLTAGFARDRMKEGGVDREITVVKDKESFKMGQYFKAWTISVTHSVPDTKHAVIETPEGIIYHGSDFKLDPAPVDDVLSDVQAMSELSQKEVLCMLVDCLRVEKEDWGKSESTTGPALLQTMTATKGKYVLTLMSSHIHRIQQAIDAATQLGRKVVFIGRSVERNVKIAKDLGQLSIGKNVQVDKRDIDQYPDSKLCVIVAGSQGQEGSSLLRVIYGEHNVLRLKQNDKVVFSANVIPGNELAYYGAIDELARNDIEVLYPDIMPALHQSGHASAPEQQELVRLVKPRFVMPIGGADRHRTLFFTQVAKPAGYKRGQVLIPEDGAILGFSNKKWEVVDTLNLRPQIVDGLGVGDVGPVVLSDRRTLGQAGIIVVVLPRSKGRFELEKISIVSRGFVFMKEAEEVIDFIKEVTRKIIKKTSKNDKDAKLTRIIERKLARKLYDKIRREPMIVPVILDH